MMFTFVQLLTMTNYLLEAKTIKTKRKWKQKVIMRKYVLIALRQYCL